MGTRELVLELYSAEPENPQDGNAEGNILIQSRQLKLGRVRKQEMGNNKGKWNPPQGAGNGPSQLTSGIALGS